MPATTLTSSQTGTLYFGYGSNLSPFQMSGRCPSSGTPIAIARLNSWFWLISERGYANLVPQRPTETSLDTDASTVWGVLYNLTPDDENALDMCEGWSSSKCGRPNSAPGQQLWKPFEQGQSTYNKLYLPVKIEKWLIKDPIQQLGIEKAELTTHIVRSLVYIDEYSLTPGRIKQSYIRRMGRAARECIPLGVPERWVQNTFSQHGIDQNDPQSFTDDIMPGTDAQPGPRSDWEPLRQQYLVDEIRQAERKS